MGIENAEDLFGLIQSKILKYRNDALRSMRRPSYGTSKNNFKPFEIERSKVTLGSLIAQRVFNSIISRHDVKKLNNKDANKLEFNEGQTTVADIIGFFFPTKKVVGKTKKKK